MQAPAVFTYEVQEHQQPSGIPRVYEPIPDPMLTHQFLMGQPLPTSVSINLAMGAPGALAWQGNQPCNLIVSPLTMQQSCQVALMRNILGIPVKFANENVIWATALGFPPPVGQIPYIQQALGGRGYLSDTACTMYNLRRHLIYMNVIQNLVNGAAPDYILLQIANVQRVSKNLRELSYNTLINYNQFYDTRREHILW